MSNSLIKKATVGFLASLMLLTSSMALVNAQGFISPSDSPEAVQQATGGEGSFRDLARRIVDYILGFLGFVAVVMVIYGGFLYVTAAGENEKIEKGKKIILYAVVGIIIILLSYAIISTVLGAASGVASP
jgi:type IV secretory pathway VirB2 component (pilin)